MRISHKRYDRAVNLLRIARDELKHQREEISFSFGDKDPELSRIDRLLRDISVELRE